jgi:hypothetical protein|uniref:Uncharacterized protein n=1 Tax=viral metagenome TaxID=1070528 RepID=A0A6C0JLF2_9ZZZZ
MHRLALILLAVFLGAFLLSVSRLIVKEGLTLPDALKVVVCSYTRIIKGVLGGRLNIHSGLTTVQCMSDKL